MLGVTALPKNLPPAFQTSLVKSKFFIFCNKDLLAAAVCFTFGAPLNALPPLTILYAVLLATTGVAPPNVTASKPASASSSTAIFARIPKVYPEFKIVLLKNLPIPFLEELPIRIASSKTSDPLTSGAK